MSTGWHRRLSTPAARLPVNLTSGIRAEHDGYWAVLGRCTPIVISLTTVGWFLFLMASRNLGQPHTFGLDYRYYKAVGERWLADGTYFWPHQVAGPYAFTVMVDVLYPPPALLLFVPLALLPAFVWWAVPACVLGYALWTWRPNAWAIATALVLTGWFKSTWAWIGGNTDLWVMTAILGGLLWGWPALFVLLKPTLAPLALVGLRSRSWWLWAALLASVSVVMLPLWMDYLTAMRNLRGIGLEYVAVSLPLMLVPFVLWAGRREPAASRLAHPTMAAGATTDARPS